MKLEMNKPSLTIHTRDGGNSSRGATQAMAAAASADAVHYEHAIYNHG